MCQNFSKEEEKEDFKVAAELIGLGEELSSDEWELISDDDAEEHEALEELYEDLRGMAGEYEIPVWTASQAGRSALEEDIIETTKRKGTKVSFIPDEAIFKNYIFIISGKPNNGFVFNRK